MLLMRKIIVYSHNLIVTIEPGNKRLIHELPFNNYKVALTVGYPKVWRTLSHGVGPYIVYIE